MSSQKCHHILGLTLALTAILACLLATSRTDQNTAQEWNPKDDFGSAEEAFHVASRAIQDYLLIMDRDPIRVHPQFRATLHSKSKLWIIKGFASLPDNNSKFYRWTVILNYHDMHEWEVVEKIITPQFITEDSTVEGFSQAQGELFSVDDRQ
jgi:hypothetical protein